MLSGDLRSFGIIDILGVIRKDKKSCILSIESEDNFYAAAYFKDGDLLLIRFLTRSFIIYLDMDFDSVLRKEGIDKRDLAKVIIERLPKFLNLKTGRFSVTTGFIKFPQYIDPPLKTENIIMYLSRNLTKEEIDRKITDDNIVFEKNIDIDIDSISLTDFEKKVLNLIDGVKTVSEIEYTILPYEILKSSDDISSEDVQEIKIKVRRSIYGLLTAGIIRQKMKFRKGRNVFDRIIDALDLKY